MASSLEDAAPSSVVAKLHSGGCTRRPAREPGRPRRIRIGACADRGFVQLAGMVGRNAC